LASRLALPFPPAGETATSGHCGDNAVNGCNARIGTLANVSQEETEVLSRVKKKEEGMGGRGREGGRMVV